MLHYPNLRRNKLIYILDDLRASTFSQIFIHAWTISLRVFPNNSPFHFLHLIFPLWLPLDGPDMPVLKSVPQKQSLFRESLCSSPVRPRVNRPPPLHGFSMTSPVHRLQQERSISPMLRRVKAALYLCDDEHQNWGDTSEKRHYNCLW